MMPKPIIEFLTLMLWKLLKADRDTYFRLLGYLKPYRHLFFLTLLSAIPLAAVGGLLALIIGPLVDYLLKNQDFTILKFVPIGVVAVALLEGFFLYINNYTSIKLSQAVSRDIRKELFANLTRLDLSFFKKNATGDVYSRFYVDTMKLQAAIVNNLKDFVIQSFSMVFLLGVLLYQNAQFALISVFIISFIVLPIHFISKKLRRLDYEIRDLNSNIIIIFTEFLYGVREIKAFERIAYIRKRFNKGLDRLFDVSLSANKAGVLLKPIMQLIGALGMGLILYLGALQIEQGTMSPGEFTTFLVAMAMMLKPVKTVGSIIGKVQVILAPAERVFEMMDKRPEILEPSSEKAPIPLGEFCSLTFKNVSFTYENSESQVLNNISFTMDAGETIALVGPSGGGKSTLVDLIPRFMDPNEGQVLINGVDMRETTFHDIRSQLAVVSQENILFDLSIRENILLGKLDATEEEIWAAARSAHLADWIQTLPAGLDTVVGERGSLLSGGQRQRVAIARAFLKNAPLLILDEATSALDNESERLVQEALSELMEGKTVIVIAHRLSTIKHADRILVIEKGRVVESGPHVELVAQEGLYRKLYMMQFREEEQVELLASVTPA